MRLLVGSLQAATPVVFGAKYILSKRFSML